MASKLLIVGAGGFGRVTLEHASRHFDCAFVDDGQAVGTVVDGVKVVGGSSDLQRLHIPIFHMEAGNRCKEKSWWGCLNYRYYTILCLHCYGYIIDRIHTTTLTAGAKTPFSCEF